MGDEDHLGDMDFKVAGTAEGITALQMDLKITSVTKDIMEQALAQANAGRLHILGKMAKAITEAKGEISDFAPAMETTFIPKEEIRVLIGKGGETIRGLCEQFNATIDVDDEGKVVVASTDRVQLKALLAKINGMFAKPEIGALYEGTVLNTTDFGAFVSFMDGKEGLVHVSEVVPVRLGHITDVLQSGDAVSVKVVETDDRGKIRLTIKEIPQAGVVAERIEAVLASGGTQRKPREDGAEGGDDNRGNRDERGPRRDRGDRGGRGGDRGPRRDGGDRGERRPRRDA
jgi:polyribonucleotide nucleotidyltransferase